MGELCSLGGDNRFQSDALCLCPLLNFLLDLQFMYHENYHVKS